MTSPESVSIEFDSVNGERDWWEWEFKEFDPHHKNWDIVHKRLTDMAQDVKFPVERDINWDAMPTLLRKTMEELVANHEQPTPQHAYGPTGVNEEDVWEIDYLVNGRYVVVFYWPEGLDD